MSGREKRINEIQKHLAKISTLTGDARSVMENGLFRVDILIEKSNQLSKIAKADKDSIMSEIAWSEKVIKTYYSDYVDSFSTQEDWKKFLKED